MILHQFLLIVLLTSVVQTLTISPTLQLLTAPSTDLANTTTGVWPSKPIIQPLPQNDTSIIITSCWPLRNTSPTYTQTILADIAQIIETKFPVGVGRDNESVTDVDAHVNAVKFHLQTPGGTSISLYEAAEIVAGARTMMVTYGPAIVYGRYEKDGATRASLSFFVEAERSSAL